MFRATVARSMETLIRCRHQALRERAETRLSRERGDSGARADHEYWFPAKRYGWGWGPPKTWQGWLFLTVWLAVILPASPYLAGRSFPLFLVFFAVMIIVLLTVCYLKGEPPRLRWCQPRLKQGYHELRGPTDFWSRGGRPSTERRASSSVGWWNV